MVVGKVIGRIVSTRKHDKLVGSKFLVCDIINKGVHTTLVAVDSIGAGIGEYVMIATGSSARVGTNNIDMPVDAAIVGIVDEENDMSIFE
jgi:ethanolamine utilization protein EutN